MTAVPHPHRDYWDDFYRSDRRADVPAEPSAFARWAGRRIAKPTVVVEVGCGTARDALWFAAQGYEVRAYDYSPSAIDIANGAARSRQVEASFEVLDLYDFQAVATTAVACADLGRTRAVYARFLLHALEPDGQRNLYDFSARVLGDGGELYCEFRTGKDRGEQHVFGEHFRSYPEPEEVVAELEAAGASIVDHHQGHGMAVYKNEDPHVCRLVARWGL